MSKFSDFVNEKKINPLRVLAISAKLEKLRPEDRAIRLARRNKGEKKEGEAPAGKPRSGRPVTQRAIDAAMQGKDLTGPQKTRILRAINRVLEQRKQEPIDLRALF